MSNRRAQDERIEGTPDGSNAISEIVDVPDAPIIGTATAGVLGASVPFTAATTGGTPSLYTATSTPGSLTGTSATSPITVSGLTGGTAYTFTVTPSNSTGTGPASSSSNSITPVDLVGAYDSLFTVTLSSAVSSVTFSNIPSTYTHLQIRSFVRNTSTNTTENDLLMKFNGDTGTNYTIHYIVGDGANTYAAGVGSRSDPRAGFTVDGSATANTFASNVTDIFDYSSVNKYKTTKTLTGTERNGAGRVMLESGVWMNTSAITEIVFTTSDGANFAQYSSFALYGVK